MKNRTTVLLGSLTFTCVFAFMMTVAFGNPAMLPDHPGHPMKPLKSPVTGQSLANDPGRNLWFEQKALNAASREGNEDMKLRTQSSLLEEERMEEKNENMEKTN
ncbi:MAG: hypothetical protein AB7P17_01475 [Nitrospirales bacterium]|nr:hypothetical protein [Nitrospirales bacterium]